MPQTDFVDLVLSQWTAECPGQDFVHGGDHPSVPAQCLRHAQRQLRIPPASAEPGRVRRAGHAVPLRPAVCDESAEAGGGPVADLGRHDQPARPSGTGRPAGPQPQPRRPARHHRVAHGRRPAHDPRRAQRLPEEPRTAARAAGRGGTPPARRPAEETADQPRPEAPGGVDASSAAARDRSDFSPAALRHDRPCFAHAAADRPDDPADVPGHRPGRRQQLLRPAAAAHHRRAVLAVQRRRWRHRPPPS